jgi:hypothetical protein
MFNVNACTPLRTQVVLSYLPDREEPRSECWLSKFCWENIVSRATEWLKQTLFVFTSWMNDNVFHTGCLCSQAYLSSEEFEKLFGITQTQFYEMPKWKQDQRKKVLDLF